MNLLLRPRPHEDESLRGFAWRLAQQNGICSPAVMQYRLLGKSSSLTILVDELLLDFFSRNYPDLPPVQQPPRCQSSFILKTGFRICPLCIESNKYLKEKWDYALLPYCFIHACKLVDVRDISLLWLGNQRISFRTTFDKPETTETNTLLAYLDYRLGFRPAPMDTSFAEFNKLTTDEFQKLVFLVGAFATHPKLAKPRKAPIKTDASTIMLILRGAAKTLINWPSNIRQILSNKTPISIKNRQVFNEYGAIHKALRKELVGAHYDFIKDDYELFLLTNWPDVIDKKSTWFSEEAKSKSNYLTGTEFSKAAEVRLNTVVDWIDRGLIEGNVRYLPTGIRQITLKKGQDEHLDAISKLMTQKDVYSYLGLTKKSARSLFEEDVIETFGKGRSKVWQVQESKIEKFIELLKSNSLGDELNENYQPLTHLRRYCTTKSGVSLAKILKKMIAGSADYVYTHKKASRLTDNIYMTADEFKSCLNDHALISIPEFAKQIGIKQEVAYHIINVGLIETIKRGRAARSITQQAIENFRETYLFLSEIANERGISSKHLIGVMRDHAIDIVSGPTIDKGRQYILRRSDVKPILDLLRG